MANNRDDKYGEHEETEYHFSDDEVTYEAESEEKTASTKPAPLQATSGFLSDWSTRKRLGVSAVAFFVLLFIVYKIVSPGSNKDKIAPVASTEDRQVPMTREQTPAQSTAAPSTPATVDINTAPPVNQAPVAAVQPQTPPPPTTPAVTGTPEMQGQTQMPATQINQMPPVMPVTSAPPTYPASSPTVESGANQLVAINNQLVAQMQSDYTQKLASVTQQNKQLEEEVQKLNASVTSIEARMNQLVQLMVRQQADSQQSKEANPVQAAAPAAPKLPYTVQAIIPGRAWLRADNGDTLTVTEGDTIKEVGKVTKIDPYDGVIEINTGRKVVSLSYGNGG